MTRFFLQLYVAIVWPKSSSQLRSAKRYASTYQSLAVTRLSDCDHPSSLSELPSHCAFTDESSGSNLYWSDLRGALFRLKLAFYELLQFTLAHRSRIGIQLYVPAVPHNLEHSIAQSSPNIVILPH